MYLASFCALKYSSRLEKSGEKHRLGGPEEAFPVNSKCHSGYPHLDWRLRSSPRGRHSNGSSVCEKLQGSRKELPMGRPVVHFEIGCQDKVKTMDFYRAMFDWKIEQHPLAPAAMIAAETGGIPGHFTSLGHEPHHYTIFYVDVDDVAAALEKAKTLGGKTLVPPVEIPNGTFAWVQDPEGNTVGLWKAKK
jgi:hypothetical protein